MSPALSNFAAAADELRRQEIARLSDALTPRIEALRSMTPQAFRATVALMLERFGHTIISNPEAPELVTSKAGQKFITACARPADLTPTGTRDLARLHDAVVAVNAQRGFFITARSPSPTRPRNTPRAHTWMSPFPHGAHKCLSLRLP
jgi:hypothetical protein